MTRGSWPALAVAVFAWAPAALAAEAPAVSPEDRTLHERLLVLDTHLDTPVHFGRPGWDILDRHDFTTDLSQVDYPRMVDGGLDGGFFVVFTETGPLTPEGFAAANAAALNRAREIRDMVARHGDRFELAVTAADAARIVKRGKRVVYMSVENSYPLGEDIGRVKVFHDLGVRMIGPVHFGNNQFGDSSVDAAGPRWNGLSPLGVRLVEEANRLGMVLDGSHASDAALDQMISLSKTPIVLSHSGSKAILDHPRNVDDARVRKLAASGGVIQVSMVNEYLLDQGRDPARDAAIKAVEHRFGPPETLDMTQTAAYAAALRQVDLDHPFPRADFALFMRQLLHILEVAGVDHVGLGLDLDGGGGVGDFKDVADLPRITAALRKAGYGEADLRKITGGNILRLLADAEAFARR